MKRSSLAIALAAAAAVVIGVVAASLGLWDAIGTSSISPAGWIAMAFGVLASLAVGVGLMALVFFSNRRGYDRLDRE